MHRDEFAMQRCNALYFSAIKPGISESRCTLTHCDLVTQWGDIDLCQNWLRQWLGAWRHQAMAWTNVDLSSNLYSGIHLKAISQVPMNLTYILRLPFKNDYQISQMCIKCHAVVRIFAWDLHKFNSNCFSGAGVCELVIRLVVSAFMWVW